MTRVLACGSRTMRQREIIESILNGVLMGADEDEDLILVTGGARGVDQVAEDWAINRADVTAEVHEAKWSVCNRQHPKYPCPEGTGHIRGVGSREGGHCPLAGLRRNYAMLHSNDGLDYFIAVVDKPLEQSRGTANMVDQCREAMLPGMVIEVVNLT